MPFALPFVLPFALLFASLFALLFARPLPRPLPRPASSELPSSELLSFELLSFELLSDFAGAGLLSFELLSDFAGAGSGAVCNLSIIKVFLLRLCRCCRFSASSSSISLSWSASGCCLLLPLVGFAHSAALASAPIASGLGQRCHRGGVVFFVCWKRIMGVL